MILSQLAAQQLINGNNLVKVGDKYYKESDVDPVTKQLKETAKPVSPADVIPSKDGAMTVKDAKGNDGVSATAKMVKVL